MTAVRLLFQDDELLAVEKPAGVLVIPPRRPEPGPTLRQLAQSAARLSELFVVHRLDRDASGIVVFAKTERAHRALCALFESRAAKKTYLVAVLGRLEGEGRVEKPLREFGSGRVGVDEKGKPSLTLWRGRSATDEASLLEIGLVTGRRHQIRAHLYSLGHPVLGDATYGRERPVGGCPRLMLHAWKLELPGRPAIVCEPPSEFAAQLRSRGLSPI